MTHRLTSLPPSLQSPVPGKHEEILSAVLSSSGDTNYMRKNQPSWEIDIALTNRTDNWVGLTEAALAGDKGLGS